MDVNLMIKTSSREELDFSSSLRTLSTEMLIADVQTGLLLLQMMDLIFAAASQSSPSYGCWHFPLLRGLPNTVLLSEPPMCV